VLRLELPQANVLAVLYYLRSRLAFCYYYECTATCRGVWCSLLPFPHLSSGSFMIIMLHAGRIAAAAAAAAGQVHGDL
jgi:hypothetical protein